MNIKTRQIFVLLFSLSIISSCGPKHTEDKDQGISNNLVMATLYPHYASEYKALAYQAYNIAKQRLADIRKERPISQNLAIVVDIDETILDNSPFEAKMILADSGFNSGSWTHWCNLAVAGSVPGAVEFLQLADSLGFSVFYISNRNKEKVLEPTMANLRKLGFPQLDKNHFLLKEKNSNKESRRKMVLKNYDIVLFAGDNLGDFYEDSEDSDIRDSLVLANRAKFGGKFIILPNAMYGKWVSSMGLPGNKNTVDSLLKEMTGVYQNQKKKGFGFAK